MVKSGFVLSLGLVGALTAGAAPAWSAEEPAPAGRPACPTHVVAGDADNGSSVCVALGGDVSILLTAIADSPWSAPTAPGDVLGPAMPLPTPFGRVGWQFRTVAPGHTEIRTSRPSRPSPTTSTGGCRDIVYRLHVTVP